MELVLIRHTRTAAPAGTCYGHSDVELAATGAQDIAAALQAVGRVDAVFSSPSRRCWQLAHVLSQRDSCPLVSAEALRELHFGDWEGQLWSDIPRVLSDPWADDTWQHSPPGGETELALWERVDRWRQQTLATPIAGRIAVVAHGGSLRALRCQWLQIAPQQRWLWQIGFGESVMLEEA